MRQTVDKDWWKYAIVVIAALAIAVTLHWYLSGWFCPSGGCRARRDFMVNFFLVFMPSFATFLVSTALLVGLLDKLEKRSGHPAAAGAMAAAVDQAHSAYDRGLACLQRGDRQAAIQEFSVALSHDARYVNAYIGRANSYADLSQFEPALADYDRALTIDPNNVPAFYNRGRTRQDMGDPGSAIGDYGQAIRLRPDYLLAFYARGLAYRDLGNTPYAIADLRQALTLAQDDETRRRLQGWLAELGAQP